MEIGQKGGEDQNQPYEFVSMPFDKNLNFR